MRKPSTETRLESRTTWMNEKASRFPLAMLEKCGALAVVVTTVMHILLYLEQMTKGSMWTDELGSIVNFFGKGPWHAVTHYPIPRNHIFFSLLNSLMPGAGLIDPVRAQLLSYGIAIILGAGMLIYFFRQRRYFEGALMFAFWGLNGELVQLSLQARGYGLLCLLAFCSSLLAVRYAERRRIGDFMLLGICTVLGAYTVPSYGLFGGALMVLLCVRERDGKALAVTGATALTIALLYAPVARELIAATLTYKQKYGEFYVGMPAVIETLTTYLWPVPGWLALVFFGALLMLPFVAFPTVDRKARALQALNVAVVFFLGACAFMRTPPVRTTCFVALPLAFCVVELIGRFRSGTTRPALRLAVCVVLLFGGLGVATQAMANFRFVPYENWLGVWRFVSTMFPPGAAIDCSRMADGLTYYVDQDHYAVKLSPEISREQFAAGDFPVIAAPWKWNRTGFEVAEFSKTGVTTTAPGKVRDITVYFAVPKKNRIRWVKSSSAQDLSSICDHDLNTSVKVEGDLIIEVDPDSPSHSLNLLFDRAPDDLTVSGGSSIGGKRSEFDEKKMVRIGNVMTIPLGDKPVGSVVLRMSSSEAPVLVKELWAN